jgi:hypothetical protein
VGVRPKRIRLYALVLVCVIFLPVLGFEVYALMNEEPVGPGPLTLEIIPDRAYYLQGQEIHFSIYVSNTHDWRVPKPTTIIYDIVNFSSQTVMIDYISPHPCFEPHSLHTSGIKRPEI